MTLLNINIDNYSGPLEVLLDLAKSQKVDLEKISITQLADQFIDFINNNKNINLDIASEYLLMATWLAYLKSKLLLPDDDEEDFKAVEIAHITISLIVTPNCLLNTLIFGNPISLDEAQFISPFIFP